ncbi:MAG: hypothetical protein U1E27_07700, partial [Kiritimatiellia bacterium]|nr:hypothetical protein [Kiritimatiellia bacterium]
RILSDSLALKAAEAWIGREVVVYAESVRNQRVTGYTDRYLLTRFRGSPETRSQMVRVRVDRAEKSGLSGVMV